MTLAADRYFDAGSAGELALELYDGVARRPIVSPHGHIDVELLAQPDARLPPPGKLLVASDHYATRMLYSQGVPLERLLSDPDDRAVWRLFAERFHLFTGTPTGLWTRETLATVFGIERRLDAESSDLVYDELEQQLASEEFAPRNLLDRFLIETIATTDPASSSLDAHRALGADGLVGRIRPTFRPDAVVAIDAPRWPDALAALEHATGCEIGDYDAFLEALVSQRAAFKELGATATDHATTAIDTTRMDDPSKVFASALAGRISSEGARRFEAHMLNEFARMSSRDGLVMQLHLGSLRDHDGPLAASFGPDIGGDIPIASDWTRGLRPLLETYDREPSFRLIVFTLDESTYSRELAPLAGHYRSLLLGSPWWFHDSPKGIVRFLDRIVETAGFANLAGFVDDARALTAIPVRHDLWRRRTCGWLARQVAAGLIDVDEAPTIAAELADGLVRRAYRL